MLISGGKVLAIDKVNNDNKTLKGDGVFNPLEVNTNVIAEVSALSSVSAKLDKVDKDLSAHIDYVSANAGKTYTQGKGIVINNNNEVSISSNYIDAITSVSAIKGTIITGDTNFNITSANSGKNILWNLELTTQPVVTDTTLSGYNAIVATKDSTVNNQWNVGLNGTYKSAIEQVSGKLDKSFSSNFYPMTGNPSGFITGIPTSSNWDSVYSTVKTNSGTWNEVTAKVDTTAMTAYYKKTETSSKDEINNQFIATSAWANETFQPKGNYLSANALKDLSGNWENTYTAVNASSNKWNSAYNLASVLSGLKEIKTFSSVNLKRDSGNDITITARNSADYFRFVANGNIFMESNNNDILISAKDTTYAQGKYIVISGDNHEISVSGVQPSGDYVSSTTFTAYQKEVSDEFTQTSAWVQENFLSADVIKAITGLSANWEEAANVVNTASGKWDSVYNTVNTASGNWETLTSIKTFSSIGGIPADSSASKLEFISGDNIDIKVVDKKIYISSHDTTYDENDFISASHFNNITSVSANVTSNSADWTSAARALEDSAANWNKTYEDFTESSTIWNDTTEAVQTNSANWDSSYNAVTASADTWNSVTAVSADLEELSGKVEDVSADIKDISGYIEDIYDDIDYISGAVDKKLDKTAFTAWSATADITPYTAGEGLALNDHQFYVSGKYITSADESLAGKMLILKDNVWEEMPEFGGFTTASPTGADSHPSIDNPSTKLIYLVKDSSVTGNDKYAEWIYTSADAQTTAWECIGETTLDLTPYLTKTSADTLYQPLGDYVTSSTTEISANKNYALTNDGTNVKWVELEDKDTIYSAGKYIDITNDNTINVSGLHNTFVTATNSTILVTPSTAQNGDVTYDLEATYPSISGINGISAGYVDDQYVVTLEDHLYSYAEAQTSLTTLTTNPETITGFNNKKIIGDNISFVNDVINLEPGLYHIDMQVYIPVAGGDNNYYNVQLVPSISYATLDQVVDGSFAHNYTLDLSFDVQIDSANTLTFELNGLPPGYKYLVKNLQIHEVTTIDSVMQATGGTYRGGVATNIDNENKINVQYATASGIAVDQATNQLYIKLGEGLKFDTSGAAAGSLSLNNITQDVVETVQELKAELDGKLTTNFPYPMISNNNTDFATYKGNGDNCICQLFSVSLTHKISTDTYFTVYMKDSGYTQTNVIFGIFEYNFDYWDEAAQRWRGQTNWVCDTGPVSLAKPTADTKLEFQVKHINPLHNELRSDRAYYAVLALKSDSGNGVFLACCDNYDGDVHSEPTLNWRWESVPNLDFVNPSGTLENTQWWDSGVNNYYEKADMRRFFLQIRNKVQPAPNP